MKLRQLVLFFGCYYITLFFLGISFAFITQSFFLSENFITTTYVVFVVVFDLMVVIALACLFWKKDRNPLRHLFRYPSQDSLIMAGAVGMILAFGYRFSVKLSNLQAVHPLMTTQLWNANPFGKSLSVILFLVESFTEEFIYRGFLFSTLRKFCSLRTSLVISSLIFLLPHLVTEGNLYLDLVFIFLIGLTTGLIFERWKYLWACVLCHFVYNLVMLFGR